ncbi:MAG: hypothetical protein V4654_04465 [Bdellovibrionota bacterium]
MKKTIFESETVLKTWKDCTLTNKRVWLEKEVSGQFLYKGFPLNQFQGAFVGKTSFPWLLYVGVGIMALSLLAFTSANNKFSVFLSVFCIGLICVGLWHFLKRAQVIFGSSEVKIEIQLHATDEEFQSALNFVSDIEQAALLQDDKQKQQAA